MTLLYVAAALLPALFLMGYIYRKDRMEKEPIGLLLRLAALGALAGWGAGFLNSFGELVLSGLMDTDSVAYHICFAFLVVGVAEEGVKLIALRLGSWNNPNFNYRFDGIVYAVFVSLGFAALENVSYVMMYGFATALTRAVTSVPAHMGFAVYMGSFYGRAQVCRFAGDAPGTKRNLWKAYLTAVFLHGFYDSCAMIGTNLSLILFLVFLVVMYVLVILRVRREARNDAPIDPCAPANV